MKKGDWVSLGSATDMSTSGRMNSQVVYFCISLGGWTLVKQRNLSVTPPSTSVTVLNGYRNIGNQSAAEYISATGLNLMKTEMGFNQIRYFCHKQSVGRTVHVMTALNDLGFDVVR